MRIVAIVISMLLFLFLVAPVTFSQIVCTQIGQFTDCSGPGNSSSTQVPLGPNQGVIITDQDTMPYTILTPQAPREAGAPTFGSVPFEFTSSFDFAPIAPLAPIAPTAPTSNFEPTPLFLGQ
jgi:hypothetical protein